MSNDTVLDWIEDIKISLKAKSKTGRYFGQRELREIIRGCDGILYYDPDDDVYLLRSSRQDLENDRHIVIIFTVNEATIHVITQSKEHGRDWSLYKQIQTQETLNETLPHR